MKKIFSLLISTTIAAPGSQCIPKARRWPSFCSSLEVCEVSEASFKKLFYQTGLSSVTIIAALIDTVRYTSEKAPGFEDLQERQAQSCGPNGLDLCLRNVCQGIINCSCA